MLGKKWVRFVSAVFHPQLRTNFTEVVDGVSLVLDFLVEFPEPTVDIPIFKDEVVEEDGP